MPETELDPLTVMSVLSAVRGDPHELAAARVRGNPRLERMGEPTGENDWATWARVLQDPAGFVGSATSQLMGQGPGAGPERYQTWPEKVARSGATAPSDAWSGALGPGPALSEERLEAMVPRAVDMTALAGAPVPAEAGAAGVFGGKLSRTANLPKMRRAHDMEAAGADPMTIWDETGWFQGADKKWKYPISDVGAEALAPRQDPIRINGQDYWPDQVGRMSDVLHHPEAYEAYPWLRDIPTAIRRGPEGSGTSGQYHPRTGIELTTPADWGRPDAGPYGHGPFLDPGIFHELDHPVQEKEGFARGSSIQTERERLAIKNRVTDEPMIERLRAEILAGNYGGPGDSSFLEAARNLLRLEDDWRGSKARDRYERQAGEVSARNAEQRWINEMRGENDRLPPFLTEDVPRARQIVTFRSDTQEPGAAVAALSRAGVPPGWKTIEGEGLAPVPLIPEARAARAVHGKSLDDVNDFGDFGRLKGQSERLLPQDPNRRFERGDPLPPGYTDTRGRRPEPPRELAVKTIPNDLLRPRPADRPTGMPPITEPERLAVQALTTFDPATGKSTPEKIHVVTHPTQRGYGGGTDVVAGFRTREEADRFRRAARPQEVPEGTPKAKDAPGSPVVTLRSDTSEPGQALAGAAAARAEPFYSAAQRAVEQFPKERAPAQEWWPHLEKNARADELDWLGLEELLGPKGTAQAVKTPREAQEALDKWKRDNPRQRPPDDLLKAVNEERQRAQAARGLVASEASKRDVTRQELLDWVRGHQAEVKEVRKGGEPRYEMDGETEREFDDFLDSAHDELVTRWTSGDAKARVVKAGDKYEVRDHEGSVIASHDDKVSAGKVAEEFNKAVREENADYLEDLALDVAHDWAEDKFGSLSSNLEGVRYGPETHPDMSLPGGENYGESLLTLPERNAPTDDAFERRRRDVEGDTRDFRSSHWDEPNVLAHVRHTDRTIDGKRSLHLEEVQSDWHQRGRKGGYTAEEPHVVAYYKVPPDGRRVEVGAGKTKEEATRHAGPDWERALNDAGMRLEFEHTTRQKQGAVPDAPLKHTWPDLALKRMIRKAAEEGYDSVSWTPGDAQAERYSLGRRVKGLKYEPGTGNLYTKEHGPEYQGGPAFTGVKPEDLPRYVGTEVAKKLLEKPLDKGDLAVVGNETLDDGWGVINRRTGEIVSDGHPDRAAAEAVLDKMRAHRLEGDDLRVGGHGMRGFYDRDLVQKANKIGEKYGAKAEQKDLDPIGGAFRLKKIGADTWNLLDEAGEMMGQYNDKAEADAALREIERASEGGVKVWVLPVTPALRRAALQEGFPLWARGAPLPGQGDRGEDYARALRAPEAPRKSAAPGLAQ